MAVRAAAEGLVVSVLVVGAAAAVWTSGPIRKGFLTGVGAAWAASAASVAWLLVAKARSTKAFWYAFGGGMALRAATLGALAAWGWRRAGVSIESLLLSYVFALLALLLTLEFRYLRLK